MWLQAYICHFYFLIIDLNGFFVNILPNHRLVTKNINIIFLTYLILFLLVLVAEDIFGSMLSLHFDIC